MSEFSANGVVGEVIEASTSRFVAQCRRDYLYHPPEFGAFVKVLPAGVVSPPATASFVSPVEEDPFADTPPAFSPPSDTPEGTLYALVFHAATGSAEPGRRPVAYGLDENTLRAEQPQIFALLTTDFSACHLGHIQNGRLCYGLPPRPPRLHAPITLCTPAEVCALTETPDFVRPLLALSGDTASDELIAASLRIAYQCRGEEFAFLVRAGKRLATLLRDDPERLASLLRKLEP